MSLVKIQELLNNPAIRQTYAARVLFGDTNSTCRSKLSHRLTGIKKFKTEEQMKIVRSYREQARKIIMKCNEIEECLTETKEL